MPSTQSARRPLKTRNTAWARGLARWLVARRVAPNHISLLSLVFAALGTAAMLLSPTARPQASAMPADSPLGA